MKIYTIILNDFQIGMFSSEVARDEAFDKFIKPNLSKKDNFIKGVK